MRCGRCGAVNPAGARFCGACGASLGREGLLSPAFLLVTAAALIIAAGGAFLFLLFASPPGPVPLVPIAGREPRLTLIEPHAGRSASVATGVSSDGSVVVGYSFNASGSGPFFWARWDLSAQRAFRWSQDAGITDIGPGSARTWAHAVSADGRWVVGGFYTGARRWHPYRWSAAEGLSDLGTLGIDWADALDVSADGRVVVGASYTPGPSPGWAVYAFRWTPEEGMRALGTLPGYRFSHALGVSADGTIVVGETNRGPAPAWNESEAWIWTPAAGMRGLGVLPPWGSSSARAVSDDGSTVIGLLFNDHDYADWAQYPHRAFRWRADTGMQDLGTLGGERTAVFHALTRDGGMVFGRSQTPSGEWRAFRWTPEKGIEDLNRLYDKAIPSGWVLREVMDCSPDGRYLVGWAEGPGGLLRAFLLDTGGVSP
jgi:probable HAF family extracellular repeat protein